MASRASQRSNKRLMDGESNPASDCQSEISDMSNHFDFAYQTESSINQDNLNMDPRFASCNDSEHASNDLNCRNSYHTSNLSSPCGTYKKIPKTPKTFPRTKINPKMSVPQRVALQSLRQHMSFTNGDNISPERNSPSFEGQSSDHQVNGASEETSISNKMVAKLIQLRDDINQVTNMIEVFQGMNPTAQVEEQLKRLIKIRHQMQNSECQLKGLYHKLTLAVREETVGAVDGHESTKPVLSQPDQPSGSSQAEANELAGAAAELNDAYKQREDIHHKLIASQQKLKAIKRKQIESDEALSQQMRLLKKYEQKVGPVNNQQMRSERSASHSNADSNDSLPAYLLQAMPNDADRDSMIPERLNDSSSVCATQLSDDAVIRDYGLTNNSNQGATGIIDLYPVNHDAYDQREKFELKLKDLMGKKQQMDRLLYELSDLKEQLNIRQQSPAMATSESRADSKMNSQMMQLPDANVQGVDQLTELNSMKQKLAHLRSMMSSYQTVNTDIHKHAPTDSLRNMISEQNGHDATAALQSSNIAKDPMEIRGQRDWSPEGHSSGDEDDDDDDDDNQATQGAASPDWSDNAEIQLKMRKLQEAKAELSKIQGLMNAVKAAKEINIGSPAACRQLLKAIENSGESSAMNMACGLPPAPLPPQPSEAVDSNLTDAAHTLIEESNRVVAECSNRMMEQKSQFELLIKERTKLMDVKQQLLNLQNQVPLNNNKQPSVHKDSNASQTVRQPSDSSAQFRFHPNFSSNTEQVASSSAPTSTSAAHANTLPKTYSEVPQPSRMLALKEELNRQSEALKELLREEKQKQQTFSHNQDNQSLQSEQYGKAYRDDGADAVAAWSGSTPPHDYFDGSQDEPDVITVYSEEETTSHRVEDNRVTELVGATAASSSINIGPQAPNYWLTGKSHPTNEVNPDRFRDEQSRRSAESSGHDSKNIMPTAPPAVSAANQEQTANWTQQMHLLQRIEDNINLSQAILRDQHTLTAMVQSSHGTGGHGLLASNIPMDQQIRHNFHQCYNIMYQQQLDIHFLQQQLNQLTRGRSDESATANQQNSQTATIDDGHYANANTYQPNPSVCIPPLLLQSNPSAVFGSMAANPTTVDPPKTLNNQVAPGTRANNYWDNFRSCSRQNLLSAHKSNQQGGLQPMPSCLLPPQFLTTQQQPPSMHPIPMDDNLASSRNDAPYQPAPDSTHRINPEASSASGENLLATSLKKQKTNKDQKTGLKNICMGNNRTVQNPRPTNEQNVSLQFARPSRNEQLNSRFNHENVPNGSFLDQIYSEAASLISENESRPMYLMELFSKLKLINSDTYRQNALCSLHNLSCSAEAANNHKENEAVNTSSGKLFNKDSSKVVAAKLTHDGRNTRKKQNEDNHSATMESNAVFPSSNPAVPAAAAATASQSISSAKSTGAIKKQRKTYPSRQTSEDKTNELSAEDIKDKVGNIITKLFLFLRVIMNEQCQPNILDSICKIVMTVTNDTCIECNANQPSQVLQNQLKRVLQDVLFKFSGRRLRDCIDELIDEVSEVVYNHLAYFLLIKQVNKPSPELSSNIKSTTSSQTETIGAAAATTAELSTAVDAASQLPANHHPSDCSDQNISKSDKYSLNKSHSTNDSKAAPIALGPVLIDNLEAANPDYLRNNTLAKSLYVNTESGASGVVEAEIEPEADISNKDLAEADQSPQPSANAHHILPNDDMEDAELGVPIDFATDGTEDDFVATDLSAGIDFDDFGATTEADQTQSSANDQMFNGAAGVTDVAEDDLDTRQLAVVNDVAEDDLGAAASVNSSDNTSYRASDHLYNSQDPMSANDLAASIAAKSTEHAHSATSHQQSGPPNSKD